MSSRTATLVNASDEILDQLLEDITARMQSGESISVEDYARAYPDYAERLHRVLPAMVALAEFGRSPSESTVEAQTRSAPPVAGVLGDFQILREIGRGGMGVVYEAIQLSLKRRVALKVLPYAALLDSKQLERFQNEARVAASLHHTHIVPVYTVGSERGVYFYAMQFIEGRDLADVIAEARRSRKSRPSDKSREMPVSSDAPTVRDVQALVDTRPFASTERYRQAASWAAEAAEALAYAHSVGVLHRDVKPANLLVDQAGAIWIGDFGLARLQTEGSLSHAGDVLGTLRYMSPEQARGDRTAIDARSDVYSLGVTLFELLALEPVFPATDRGVLLAQIADREPRSLRAIDPLVPADLAAIVSKAIEKDAADRYPSAAALAADLRNYLAHRTIVARPPTWVQRTRKWARRHRAVVGVAAVATIALAIGGIIATGLTLRAYQAEAKQRTAAEANLAIASEIIEHMVSRVASDRYYQGDLKQAETLAAEATNFYEELLKRSDDPTLRYQAALAYGEISNIWQLIGRYEKAGIAGRQASRLIERLTTQYPGEPKYLVALAGNYQQIGMVDWALDRPIAAEPAWRQSWEIWTELAERFPQEPSYQYGVSRMLANLGCVCYLTGRFPEAEEYYKRSDAIKKHLPEEMNNSTSGLASHAGSLTNQAEMARLRGDYDRALELLEASIPYHERTLEKWPTNPAALACYCEMFRNMIDCHLDAARPEDAAATVERLIEAFPDRLEAYQIGIDKLRTCSAFANEQSSQSDRYLARAHKLVDKARTASQRTPETSDRFAWLLLTCEDESFRDAEQALALAKAVVEEAPERGDYWFTLALAEYRNGDWQAAEEADKNSIEHSLAGQSNAYDWLLLAMIRAKQGRVGEARLLLEKAKDWIAAHNTNDQTLHRLTDEASVSLSTDYRSSTSTFDSNQPPR